MKQILHVLLSILLFHFFSCRQEKNPAQQASAPTHSMPEQGMHIEQGLKAGDTSQIAQLVNKGNAINEKFPDSAMAVYKEALALSYRIHYSPGIAVNLLNLGSYFYIVKADYPRARAFFYRAIPYSQSAATANKRLLPGTHISIGNTYFQEGDYDSANYFYYKALNILRESKIIDTQQLIQIYMNIGAALEYIDKDYNRSMKYSLDAEQLAYKAKDTLMLLRIVKNISTLHTRTGNYDSALMACTYALQLVKQLHINKDIQDMYTYIANALLYQKEIAKAKLYLDSAVSTDKKNVENNLILLQNLGQLHFFSGDFKKAISYLKQALKLSSRKVEKLNSYATLAIIYDTIGQGHLAYRYQRAYSELKDSMINENKIIITNNLEIKYRSAEKDRQLAIKDLEIIKAQAKNQQKTGAIWITSLCILLLISILAFLRYRQVYKLRKLRQQKELDMLKATMEGEEAERVRVGQELHDGVSGLLSAIKMNLVTLRLNRKDIAGERNFITTMELTDEAADELRKTAHNLVPSSLMKNGLHKAIKGFCERVSTSAIQLQILETGNPLRLDAAQELIIYRTIQELTHNIIKHSGATSGQVSLSWQEKLLLVTVEDNGMGIAYGQSDDGIGLDNIRKGIKKLNASMEIDSISGEGTSIYLEYPL